MNVNVVGLLLRYLVGVLVGFLYVYFWTRYFHPKLLINGKQWHHHTQGTILGLFVIIPLVFFFYILNFDLLTLKTAFHLLVSLLGLATGTAIQHRLIEDK